MTATVNVIELPPNINPRMAGGANAVPPLDFPGITPWPDRSF